MAIAATHLPGQYRVSVLQLKLAFLVQVTRKADIRLPAWIDDRIARPAGLIVNTPRTVARFATDVLSIRSLSFDAHMRRRLEITHDLGMTLRASLRAHVLRAGNLWWNDNRLRHGRAGQHANGDYHRAHNGHGLPAGATQSTTSSRKL